MSETSDGEELGEQHLPRLYLLVLILALVVAVPALLIGWIVDRRLNAMERQQAYAPIVEVASEAGGTVLPENPTHGQLLYVPAYSHIYSEDGKAQPLTVTLSVRNTSQQATLILSRVEYYDTKGQLVRAFIQQPMTLGPLESRDFLVKRKDWSGGSGANFLLEWLSAAPVSPPVVEALMVDTSRDLGIAFARPATVVAERGGGATAPPLSEEARSEGQ